jgi:hypothetical protein
MFYASYVFFALDLILLINNGDILNNNRSANFVYVFLITFYSYFLQNICLN